MSSLLAHGTDIYVGGTFTTAGGIPVNHIAKWDGANWSALGSGLNGQQALAMAWMGSELIVGGGFLSAGGVANTSRLAKWNGTTWSSLGVGTTDSNVQALLVDGTDLYVAGGFTTIVGFPANRIAKWDGSAWSSLGTGMNGAVMSLAKSGSDLYAGGNFTTAGGTTAGYIAKWNGGSWSALSGGGMNATVWALAFHGSYLYAGGQFTAPAQNLARWNGTSWSAVGGSTNGPVRALTLYAGELYIGGAFNIVTGTTANYIAKYDGNTITAFGTGINTSVVAFAHDGTDLYIGGVFTQAGDVDARYVAKWDGSTWSALGAGMNGTVYVLTFIGGDLYAGGDFTTAGGAPANRIAKWNGSSWTGLGTGTNGRVRAIAPFGPDIIVGGEFTSAGGLANTGYIAKWTGAAWNVMATGVNGNVLALHPSGADLYAGGDFTTMSGVSASKVAKWNGSSWSALGIGLTSTVTSLATIGTDLFAGGAFTLVGPPFITTNRVAKWDGSAWSALGTALNNTVRSLAVHGTDLIAVGDFTTAGGAPANRVAKWNGSAWSAFGSGVDNNVNRVIVVGDDMYVGGNFLHAGGQVSPWLARGILGPDSDGDGTVDELDDCPFAVDGIADFDANTCACNLGYYATITDIDGNDVITACTICPPGYFCADGLSSQPCPAGSFSATSGQQACQLCAVNTYNPTIAQTECLACPNGEISDLGATECTPNLTCITDLDIIFQPDGVSDIGWELRAQGSNALVQSGNGVYPASPGYSLATCLPDGCFYLVVTDDGGDGITGGGYQLRVNSSGRLIDNLRDAFGNGGFTTGSVSQIANGEGFCLPLGQDRLIFTSCDKLDWRTGPCNAEYVYANDNALVTAEYGVSNATSGYQMWWFDPNGGYSFRRFQSHSTNNGLPVSATRACGFRLNNWSGNQLAQGVLYNVKVRGRVDGTFLPWGPACRLMLDDAAAQCPRTKLMDIPGNQFLSCGATRPVANNAYVHARSVRRMQGNCTYINANRYQFRFRIVAENFVLVKTSATGQYFVNTMGLACGKTYEVDVRASFDNGATWCAAGGAGLNDPAWGDVCLLTTSNCLTGGGQSIALQSNGVNGALAMYPNPNRGDQLFINLTQVEEGVNTVSVDIYDGFGKRMAARTIAVTDGYLNTVLELNGELATGMYLVNITAGGTVHTERLVIQP